MSARMQYPLSQRRHTNIAVVRYSKNGVKLEIACYKNKVISYRAGTEDRLDEVLQVDRIFSNVARGYVASEKDIETVFGPSMSEQEAIKFMLVHGELQVAQQERTHEVDEMFKDIALIISQKCVNTKTQRPFPAQVIEQALRSIGAGVKLDQPVKKQALGLIHQLIDAQVIPIARANMKLRCLSKTEAGKDKILAWCAEQGADVEVLETKAPNQDNNKTAAYSVLLVAQPHLFRDLDIFVKQHLPAGSTVHMVEQAVTAESTATGAEAVLLTQASTDARSTAAVTAEGTDHSTTAADSEHGGQGAPAPPSKKGKGKGKGKKARKDAAHDVSDDEDEDEGTTGAILVPGDDDDDDDDNRRKNKKDKRQARKAKKQNAAAAAAVPKQRADDDDDDDDDAPHKGSRGKNKKKKKGGRRGDSSDDDVIGSSARGADELLANMKRLGIADDADSGSKRSDSDGEESEDSDFAPRKNRRGKKN